MNAVLVDLDGTLVDSAPDIVAAAIRHHRRVHRQRRADAGAAGAGGQRDRAGRRRHYDATNGKLSRVFPGVVEGLHSLRTAGFQVACVTNKPQAATVTLLALTGLTQFFDAVGGGNATPFSKPHAGPLLHACALLGADPLATVLVGDSHVDVAAARAAGMPVYIVRYGYPGAGSLDGATLIDSFVELPALLQKTRGTCVPHSAPS